MPEPKIKPVITAFRGRMFGKSCTDYHCPWCNNHVVRKSKHTQDECVWCHRLFKWPENRRKTMPNPNDYEFTDKELTVYNILHDSPTTCGKFNKFFTQLSRYFIVAKRQGFPHHHVWSADLILAWACKHHSNEPLNWLIGEGFIAKKLPDLKPCAHCGCSDTQLDVSIYQNKHYAVCLHCLIRTKSYNSKREASVVWNRRNGK